MQDLIAIDSNEHDIPPIDVNEIVIEIASVGEVDHRLDIEIPAKQIKRFQKKLKKSGQEFRDDQIVPVLVKVGLDEGIKRHQMKTLWGPRPLVDLSSLTLGKDKPLAFTFMIDQIPEVTWPPFDQIEIKRPLVLISDDMIEDEISRQKMQEGERIPCEGPIETGQEILIDISLKGLKDELTLDIDDVRVPVPKDDEVAIISGIPIPDFAKLVAGSSIGEEILVDIEAPEELADSIGERSAVLALTVKGIWNIESASMNRLVEIYGSRTEQVLRQQIRLSLKSKSEQDQVQIMLNQLFNTLTEAVPIPIPDHVINHIIEQRTASTRQLLLQQGRDEMQIEAYFDDHREEWHEKAIRNTRMRGVVNMLCRENQIRVNEIEVQEIVNAMAANHGVRPEQMRKRVIENDMISGITYRCQQTKCFEHFKPQLNIVDISIDEWNAEQEATQG